MSTPAFNPARVAELYQRFGGLLLLRFKLKFRDVDEQLLADAIVEAVMALVDAPEPIPQRQIAHKARERLRSVLRSDTRRREREKNSADRVTKIASAVPSLLEELADRETARLCRDRIAQTDYERKVLDLWLSGCKNAADLASEVPTTVDEANLLLRRFRKRIERERGKVGLEGA